MTSHPNMNRAVFLDRDGVINPMVRDTDTGNLESPYGPDLFDTYPNAPEAVKLINKLGFLTIVISNQPGVAKGKCTPEAMELITNKMQMALESVSAKIDAVYYCFHHPDGIVPKLTKVCACRKPEPGMLLEAANVFSVDLSQSYMVGDTEKDIGAGSTAGCKTILVSQGVSRNDLKFEHTPTHVVHDILDAAKKIQALEAALN